MLTVDPQPGVLLSLRIDEDTLITWHVRDHNKAQTKGWYLDSRTASSHKDDDSDAFADANAVIEHLCKVGAAGDDLAIRAMIFTNHSNLMSWVARLQED